MFMTDWIIASILPSMLCDWSIMKAMPSAAGAQAISHMIRKSSNGSTEPTIRSSSAYLRLLKWKPPSRPSAEEHGHDLLDVRPERMVAGVDEDLRLRAELPAEERCGAPVGKVGAVERRLEELVLDQQPHASGQRSVELLQACDEPLVPGAQVVLARVVRPVGEPEADDASSRPARRWRCTRGNRPARVPRIASSGWQRLPSRYSSSPKRFGLMAPMPQALAGGMPRERRVVVDRIPGDVQRHARAAAGEAVDERRRRRCAPRPYVAAPGHGKTWNLVPELPYPHDGVSISSPRSRVEQRALVHGAAV